MLYCLVVAIYLAVLLMQCVWLCVDFVSIVLVAVPAFWLLWVAFFRVCLLCCFCLFGCVVFSVLWLFGFACYLCVVDVCVLMCHAVALVVAVLVLFLLFRCFVCVCVCVFVMCCLACCGLWVVGCCACCCLGVWCVVLLFVLFRLLHYCCSLWLL